jgi:hypothetical protein
MSENRLLLVEGIADKSFYEEFCRAHGLRANVTVAKPKDIGGRRNTKQGAINHLPLLLQQIADGRLERLAILVDADQVADGGGYVRTLEQIAALIRPFGFDLPPEALDRGGLIFPHNDGLPGFGLWVMPNNRDEGTLEEWIRGSVHPDELPLFTLAQAALRALNPPKYPPIRATKAEVATWLAWQQKPGEGIYYTIEGSLLNHTSLGYVGLLQWLERLFR